MKMKNKLFRTSAIAIIIVFIFSAAAFAISTNKTDAVKDTNTNAVGKVTDNDLSLDKNIKFKQVVEAVKAKNLIKDDFYKIMLEYADFIKVYQPKQEDLEYINKLIVQGDDVHKLIEIYRFWLDTDEDISMIKSIYDDYKPIYENNEYWVEDVFNEITQYKNGVLTTEEVNEYLKKGLTADDISTANRLSRAGKLTIQQILERKLTGSSWLEIAGDIYSKLNKKEKTNIDVSQVSDPEKQIKGSEILNAIHLSKRTGQDIQVYLRKLENGESLIGDMNECENRRTVGILDILKRQGLWGESSSLKEKNDKARQDLRGKIKENGISESKIDEFNTKGYSDLDVLNASEIVKKHNTTLDKVFENKAKGQSFEEMMEEGVQ